MKLSSADGRLWKSIGDRLGDRLNQLVLMSPNVPFKEFDEECAAAEDAFCEEAAGRSTLILEIRRRLQECRLRYWVDRPGHSDAVREHLLARCALGFEAPWHEAQVFYGAVFYLWKEPADTNARRLLEFLTARVSSELDQKPNPALEGVFAHCQGLAGSSRMSAHKLRFLNPALQTRFLDSVRRSGLDATISGDGSFECSEEQWQEIISLAHKVRDSCFKWYFSWCDSQEGAKDLEHHLRSNGLRFELEDHGDHLVFLLPREDQEKHHLPDDPIDHENCSFCGKSWTESKRFVTSKAAAICDECIGRIYSDLRERPPSCEG